jgi:hypothetical protein
MRLWDAARVPAARLNITPTTGGGTGPFYISDRTDLNPYCLRWMLASTERSEVVLLVLFMVVGGLGSGGQRDDSDNGSL